MERKICMLKYTSIHASIKFTVMGRKRIKHANLHANSHTVIKCMVMERTFKQC